VPVGKDKSNNNKRRAKVAPKKKRKKKTKEAAKTSQPNKVAARALEDIERDKELSAEKRVAAMREKLKKSMEDPEMRDQIVRAIRTMLNEGR
jgi:hypothetical protein